MTDELFTELDRHHSKADTEYELLDELGPVGAAEAVHGTARDKPEADDSVTGLLG